MKGGGVRENPFSIHHFVAGEHNGIGGRAASRGRWHIGPAERVQSSLCGGYVLLHDPVAVATDGEQSDGRSDLAPISADDNYVALRKEIKQCN